MTTHTLGRRLRAAPAIAPRGVPWFGWGVVALCIGLATIAGDFAPNHPLPQPSLETFVPGLGVLALALTGMLVASGLVLGRTGSYDGYCMIRWSISLVIAMCGPVVFLLGAPWHAMAVFVGWGLLVHLSVMPTIGDRRRFWNLVDPIH